MEEMKMTGEVMKDLKVTRVTLFGWIRNGFIKAEKAGSGGYYLFSDEEIERIKGLLPKKRERGFQITKSIKKD